MSSPCQSTIPYSNPIEKTHFVPGPTIHQAIMTQAQNDPNAIAIAAPGRQPLTYGRLYAHILEVTAQLNGLGIGCNDRVAIVMPNGPEMAVTFCAVAAAAVSAPLNPAYRSKECEFYLSSLNVKALIIPAELESPARKLAEALDIVIIDLLPMPDEEAGIFCLRGARSLNSASDRFAKPEDIALVLFTSGTTSKPKIVPLTHANLCTSAANIGATLRLSPADRCLNIMPLFHIHGLIGATLSSLYAGGSIVCTPGFDEKRFFQWMDDYSPTWYTAVPTMHQAVLSAAVANEGSVARSSLRFIRSSSAALPPVVMAELENQFKAPVIESYGMTEAAHQMTSNPLPPGPRKAGSVGLPAGPEVSIMDESGNLHPMGKTGEIVIRGVNVTSGYENNPEANASAFTNGWFRTGDQGRIDDDGYLYITGRLKEMINRGGENIAPREIDEVLLNHPDIVQAIAFAVPHPSLGEDVAAAVVLEKSATITAAEIRDFAFSQLADFKVPSQILIVAQIPKGPTGKLQRIGLADKLSAELKADYVPPTDQLETDLVRIWAQTLEVDQVGIDDNFFTLGGDSLLAAYLFTQIEELINEKLPLAILFRAPTIKQLAEVLRERTWEVAWSSLVPIKPRGSKPPFFCIHAHGGSVIGYRDLARHLGPDQPFYGLQAQDIESNQAKPRRFEDMAAHYLREIQSIQPHGPYYLGGWCLGGNVAYEMAQQLRSQGQEVALLVMIQSTPPVYSEDLSGISLPRRIVYRMIYRLELETSNFSEIQLESRVHYSVQRIKRLLAYLQVKAEGLTTTVLNKIGVHTRHSRLYILKTIEETHNKAYEAYKPQPYVGDVTLFRASKQPVEIQQDPTLGWRDLIEGELEVQEIPGYRLGMLSEPRVQIVAERLKNCIDKASRTAAEM